MNNVEYDSQALELARRAMCLMKTPLLGGDVQLQAKIQNLFIEAMKFTASQTALLAAHEQEPVMYASPETLHAAKDGEHLLRTLSKPSGECVIPLFTHPAPVPAVPDAIKWPAEKFCPAEYAGSLLWNETEIWNKAVEACQDAYRAAMLNQAPVKQPSSKQNSELRQRAEVRAAHAEWAAATFGNTGPVGPLKHLSAEALETAAAPDDLSEWADMQFLFWDAQRKAGVTDEQITAAMVEKLEINKARQWPEPKEGEPRFHIKDGE